MPRRRVRILRAVALLSAGLLIFGLSSGNAGGQVSDFVRGSGSADARIIRVGPSAAQLSLAPTVGVALADYRSTQGLGESLIIDWVALGTSVPKSVRDQVPSLRADTSASEECWDRVKSTPEGSPLGVVEQRAKASPDGPSGSSSFTIANFGVPGVIDLRNAVARSTTAVLPGEIREARAVTEIGELSLAGAVTLVGLRWEAVHRSGGEDRMNAAFSIEALEVLGLPVPLPEGGVEDLLGTINDTLEPLGFAIRLPSVRTEGGVARISPLGFSIFESEERQGLIGPVIENLQPIREQLVAALFELGDQFDEATGAGESEVVEGNREVNLVGCPGDPQPTTGSSSPIPANLDQTAVLLADIMGGVVSGVSSLDIVVGGVEATTEGEAFDNPFGDAAPFELPEPVTQLIPGTPDIPPVPPVEPSEPTTQLSAPPEQAAPAATRTEPGERGGIAILIGAIGLALALLLGGRDWYLIRRHRAMLPSGPQA